MSQRRIKTVEQLKALPQFQVVQRQGRQRIQREFNPYKREKRHLPLDLRKKILFTYYGSLTRFDRPIMTQMEASRKLMIRQPTLSKMLKRFRQSGHDISRLYPKRVPFRMISPRLKRTLLSKQLLQEWGPFSIKERVRIIDRVWQQKINWATLINFYKAHKVKYLRSREVYSKALRTRAVLEPLR